jgi:hypothetical protein
MDGSRFDRITRTMATGTTRRGMVTMLAGGALAVLRTGDGFARESTVGICHKTWAWSTDWRYITVSARDERKIQSHLEHGDTVNPDFDSDPNHCGECGNACEAPVNATAFCSDGGCAWTCDSGYVQEGDACVVDDPCPLYTSDTPLCYYLDFAGPGLFCWRPYDNSYDFCHSQDSCAPGGGGASNGGCFKWTNNSNDPFTSWPS